MLHNFVTSQELLVMFPQLSRQLPNIQSDFQPQISLAYDKLLNDLYNSGYDVRQISPYLQLGDTPVTVSVPATGSAITAFGNVKRFVVEVLQHSGVVEVNLEGSWNSNDWTSITTLSVGSSDGTGLFHSPFDSQFKYYRYTASGSVTANIFLSERAFDMAIAAQAMVIVFRSQLKEAGDMWHTNMVAMDREYQLALGSTKFLLDSNRNQVADSSDKVVQPLLITRIEM